MQFDQGYISAYMMQLEKMEAVLDEPYILLTDKKITMVKDLAHPGKRVIQRGKPFTYRGGGWRKGSPCHPGP